MTNTKENKIQDAPQAVAQLVERFTSNIDAYRAGRYNETQIRREFIDPLFTALGWDVANRDGYAEAYKDVIHEDAIKVGGVTKAPDYCFRIGGARKFFVEAKKPAVNIARDANPAYQLRRYAWSAKLPLSVLTDFEEFAVYDCRTRPKQGDKPTVSRTMYFKYDQYLENWNEIAGIFGKQAVLQGSFDKYVTGRKKRGTAEVDDEFLREIEKWRAALARNIALRNAGKTLHVREINFAVQRTIDRIIFLRMCEDRGVETYGSLQALINGEAVYSRLMQMFRAADDRYNSGLFHFNDEKNRPHTPDTLTPGLEIDDKVLKDIFRALYYPQSPYEFSVLPADILGNVYEQFLGKVIHLTPSGRASVEEKPEVKKAGGVYYTPKYIVDYIVKHTVGRLVEGKKPPQIKKLRILDPACGSGSFLVGAYKFLLDCHLDWYLDAKNGGPKKYTKQIHQGAGGQWYLTTAEKKEILLNNIYGVDIDPQAVEVTKLNLLLCVLENENQGTVGQLALIHQRVLPDLAGNIKCGNSLIGPDFYQGKQLSLFDEEAQYKINAFDWQTEFPEIFKPAGKNPKKPGFDAVIGNPPYLISAGQEYHEYFGSKYQLTQYQTDFYVYFIEGSLKWTKEGGYVSFIVSDAWLNAQYFSKLREHLLTKHRLEKVVVFDYPVFKKAAMENSMVFITCGAKSAPIPIIRFSASDEYKNVNMISPPDALRLEMINPQYSAIAEKIITKIERGSSHLVKWVKINRGMHAYRTDGYGQSKFGSGPQTKKDKEIKSYHADRPLDDTYLPELRGKHVYRFSFTPSGAFVSYGPWLAEPRTPEYFLQGKVALRKVLGTKLSGTFIEEPYALDQSLYILISPGKDHDLLKHLLGIMVSRLGAWYIRTKYSIYDKLYPWYTKKQLAEFPVKPRDDRMVELVEVMLELHKQLPAARTPDAKDRIQRQITATDKQIDNLVYELYGLTEEEIVLVEEKK